MDLYLNFIYIHSWCGALHFSFNLDDKKDIYISLSLAVIKYCKFFAESKLEAAHNSPF